MHEGDLLDWLSVAAVAAAALAAGLHAVRSPVRRAGFVLLAALLAVVAADDAFGLHERLTEVVAGALGVSARGDVLFLLPYLPLLAAVAVTLLRIADSRPDLAGRVIRVALCLLALAVGLRLLRAGVIASGHAFSDRQRTLGDMLLHDTELVAWLVVGAGLVLAQTTRTSARTPRSSSDRRISST